MTLRFWSVVAVAWVVSLLAVGSWASAQASRQWSPVSEPAVVSGENLGLRVEWMHGNVPTGTLVVRVKGVWMEAQIGKPPIDRVIQTPPPAPPPPR